MVLARACAERQKTREAGFTLIEALVALAIGGFIVATLATVTGQWLGTWSRGSATLQQAELLIAGLDRIAADLETAQFVPQGDPGTPVQFSGTDGSVAFVRRALETGLTSGLEIVRLARSDADPGATLLRSQTPLGSGPAGARPYRVSPVVLLRAPYRAVFAYAGEDQVWRPTWNNARRLPRAIRISVVGGAGPALSLSTVVTVHVDVPAACAAVRTQKECDALIDPAATPRKGMAAAILPKEGPL